MTAAEAEAFRERVVASWGLPAFDQEPAYVAPSVFVAFACPICGRTRDLSPRAMRLIQSGKRDGTCARGEGCQAAVSDAERYRRFWLAYADVPLLDILRAGGARGYVVRHGLPDRLGSLLCEP